MAKKKAVRYGVVDAFTESAFKGNPAAVCLLEEERDEQWLQSVAAEFNISETCYLTRIDSVPDSNGSPSNPIFNLRWFTPVAEVKLCGHATLAASYFLFQSGLVNSDTIEFSTLSGILTAKRVPEHKSEEPLSHENGDANAQSGYSIELDFPVITLSEFNDVEVSAVSKVLDGVSVIDIKKAGDDLFVVLPSEKAVAELQPRFSEIEKCPGRGLIVTGLAADGSGFDFVSRFFCPKLGINEDPVCGSAHCALASYWRDKLGKCDFVAYQASPRGGTINVHLDENNGRVFLRGKAVTVMEGSLLV